MKIYDRKKRSIFVKSIRIFGIRIQIFKNNKVIMLEVHANQYSNTVFEYQELVIKYVFEYFSIQILSTLVRNHDV
jgi:hypothetical protein